MRTPILLLVLASACVTAESFPKAAAKTACDRQIECAGESSGIDQEACEDDFEAFAACFVDNCDDFDAKAANDCLDALRDYDCTGGTDLTVCLQDVYTTCSNLELIACVATTGL